jgi:protoporphyrinogen oxidase
VKIGIVGGGATGLTAGYELSKSGHQVVIYEQEPECGGLVRTVKVGGQNLEQFYHHVFTSDQDLIDLLGELDLNSRLVWISPHNGIYLNNQLHPFTSPLDLLRFKELTLLERISLGLLVYKAKMVKDWDQLEKLSAKDWIIQKAGPNVYRKVWGPLLNSKFDHDADRVSAAWIWNKFKLRGSTRGKNPARELLGYLNGSFGVIYQTLVARIIEQGGMIASGREVTRISPRDDGTLDLSTRQGTENFERVIVTAAPEVLLNLAGLPENYAGQLKRIKYKANICLILELEERLSPYYWISVADNSLPFVAVIEQTNFMPVQDYRSHVVYLSRYLDAADPLYSASDEAVKEQFIAGLKRMFPDWKETTLQRVQVNRTRYAQPVVFTNYSAMIPGYQSPVDHLYLACMAQIYPEDRGQTYAIRMGKEIAKIVNGSEDR